jgi:hypothetical protein
MYDHYKHSEAQPPSAGGKLGLQGVSDEQYEAIAKYKNYTYTVAPPTGMYNSSANQHIERLLGGSLDPTLTVEEIERLRERIQVQDSREQRKTFHLLSQVWISKLASEFQKNQDRYNHAEIEKMFYPSYAPKYFDAVKALDLPRKWYWRRESFDALEQMARMVLAKEDMETKKIPMSFEEWYHIHWNFYMAFSAIQFVCATTSEQCIWTQEFVTSLAEYCKERLDNVYSKELGTTKDAPILMLGNNVGKLTFLLNQTKICPVPFIASHERPNHNPYILQIPPHLQNDFTPKPIQQMKDADALEKYQPSMVLLSNMKANVDITSTIRRFGCVKEYLTIGIPDSYSEGHGWDTFGAPHLRDKNDQTTVPAFAAAGFDRMRIPTLSRWLLHKHDCREVFGLATVEAFCRKKYYWPLGPRMKLHYHGRWSPVFY